MAMRAAGSGVRLGLRIDRQHAEDHRLARPNAYIPNPRCAFTCHHIKMERLTPDHAPDGNHRIPAALNRNRCRCWEFKRPGYPKDLVALLCCPQFLEPLLTS